MLVFKKTIMKSRKSVRNLAIGGSIIATTLALSTGGLENVFNRIVGKESPQEIVRIANDAIDEAVKRGATELFIDGGESSVPTSISADGLTVVHESSSLLNPYFAVMGKESETFVKDNTEWFVFSPNVTKNLEDVNGLYLGNGIVAIDTMADNGGIKNPKTFPSIIGHEAQHGADEGNGMSILEKEIRSDRRELGVLESYLEKDDDLILKGHYNDAGKRIETGEFLFQFGNDFGKIDPSSVILARDLLRVGISPEKLREYTAKFENPQGLEYELYVAAKFGDVAMSMPREDAIRALYGFATTDDPKYKDTIVPVSAASALQYLAPNVARVETDADVGSSTERTANIHFGDRADTSDVGRGVKSEGKPTVSGLPSLEELIGDERFEDLDTSEGNSALAKGELYSGNRVAQKVVDGTKTIYLPNREGKPGDGFFRFYINALDTDGNGVDDTLAVYYGSNAVAIDGSMLAKVDNFKDGKYFSSGVSWMQRGLKEKGEDIPLDVSKTWRDWKME